MAVELEFVPFTEDAPDTGSEVRLEVPNPDYEAELAAHRAGLELNPFARCYASPSFCPQLSTPPEDLVDADQICITSTTLSVVVGYPFAGRYRVAITSESSKGFTHSELFRQLVRIYSTMYAGASAAPIDKLDNMDVQSPRFGQAWHEITDLVIERVVVAKRGRQTFAWIAIGS